MVPGLAGGGGSVAPCSLPLFSVVVFTSAVGRPSVASFRFGPSCAGGKGGPPRKPRSKERRDFGRK